MMLPEFAIGQLQGLLPGLDLRSIDFIIAEPLRVAAFRCCPHAYIKAGSSPYFGTVMIHPDFWAPDTIKGLQLVAHELYHQFQQRAPNFDLVYDAMALEAERQRQPPWRHPLERPAYEFEKALPGLLAQGARRLRWQ